MARQHLDHNAYAFQYSSLHRDDTIFAHGQFYRYSSGVWMPIHDFVISKEIKELLERAPDLDVSANVLTSVTSLVKIELYIPDEKMDANPNLINLSSGMYDIETGTELTHLPGYYSTAQLPFPYDKTATCPVWEHFLQTSLIQDPKETGARNYKTDPQLIDFVQEAVGYSLTNDNKYHVTFWCLGRGRNGKGVLFDTLEKLAGSGATTINLNLLHREQYQLANLVGKRIALCTEANSTDNLVEDATIKALIAGDTMSVRMIRREPFDLKPRLKLWWSMNRLPTVADTSIGFWSRIRIIPFHRIFVGSEKDVDLKDKLIDEYSGIFNWAMRGLERLRIRGAFEIPTQVERFTDNYQRESNPVQMFVEENCTISPMAGIPSSNFYNLYRNWCVDNGYKPLSHKNVKREMELLGYYSTHQKTGTVYMGLVSNQHQPNIPNIP